jgi:hypothetical protein
MYVGDTTPESRKNWIAALDRLAALNPAIVVAGHKKPGAPDSPSTIQDTKHYLQDFDRLQKTATSRPGAVRSDDGVVPGLGSQSVVVDVRIPAAITRVEAFSFSFVNDVRKGRSNERARFIFGFGLRRADAPGGVRPPPQGALNNSSEGIGDTIV